jgi:tetratricopeptide (TPR) repeat protein
MVKLYDSQKTYTDQLRKLEEYVVANPKDAAAHFLLGYHYMVCGYIDLAKEQFETAAKLQPADTVSRELANLLAVSTKAGDEGGAATEAKEAGEPEAAEPSGKIDPKLAPPKPEPVPLEKLNGTWVADKGKQGKITLVFKDDGKFTWTYSKPDGKPFELEGEYTMDERGYLVLKANDTQMVSVVSLPKDNEMKFVLAAGPPGDPGITFKKG